jgi:hypothetical protein
MNIEYITPPLKAIFDLIILKLDDMGYTICECAIDGCLFTTTQLSDKDKNYEVRGQMHWYIT